MVLQNRFPTRDRMLKWGLNKRYNLSFLSIGVVVMNAEITYFFECPMAKRIWRISIYIGLCLVADSLLAIVK